MHQNLDGNGIMALRDWRQAIRTPTAYRVGNSTLRIQTHFVSLIAIIGLLLLVALYTVSNSRKKNYHYPGTVAQHVVDYNLKSFIAPATSQIQDFYNSTYPLTPPIKTPQGITYRIGIISDMDKESKIGKEFSWQSYLKTGHLNWNPKTRMIKVTWDASEPLKLKSNLGEGGRGMELSELITFNAKILSVDDRTGVIYEVDSDKVIPWVLLPDGDGRMSKGFKMEWAAVKDHVLYVGGLGKEWTSGSGDLINHNPQWIKTISTSGEVSHLNWRDKYNKIRSTIGIEFPGYIIHEAVAWSNIHRKWFFLPRRSSKERYDEVLDNERGTNMIITANEDFNNIQVSYVGEVIPTHGFSSFKFLPDTDDEVIVALKTMETAEKMGTFIMAFTIRGKVLLPETLIADIKYEGLEFI